MAVSHRIDRLLGKTPRHLGTTRQPRRQFLRPVHNRQKLERHRPIVFQPVRTQDDARQPCRLHPRNRARVLLYHIIALRQNERHNPYP